MIITKTPLRISFIGGGTDFREFFLEHGGAVVNSTIDKFIYVIAKERFDDLIVLNYSKREIVDSVNKIKHNFIREAMIKTGVEKGVEITTLADIPTEGTGLGSSGAVLVGLLHSLYSYQHELVSAEQLASDAYDIEVNILKAPVGLQDQYTAAYGGLRFYEFKRRKLFMIGRDWEVTSKKVELSNEEMSELNSNLMLFYLNRERKSSSILTEQLENIDKITDKLIKVHYLAVYLASKPYSFDSVMRSGWEIKKGFASNISNPEIDKIYDTAIEAGASGGKVVGAGGGGFMLLYVIPKFQKQVRETLRDLKELPFNLEPNGSRVVFNER